LTGEYQAVSGAVNTSSTPEVQYVYSQPTGDNYSRLSAMIYPNGRQLGYVYNTGVDTTISRVSGISDDAGTGAGNDQSYTYLGLDTIVQENDGNGVELTYIHQSGDTLQRDQRPGHRHRLHRLRHRKLVARRPGQLATGWEAQFVYNLAE
jgi:hypothetical protein